MEELTIKGNGSHRGQICGFRLWELSAHLSFLLCILWQIPALSVLAKVDYPLRSLSG